MPIEATTEKDEYVLGTHSSEAERLQVQHAAWVEFQYRLVRRAGVRAGQTVVDLGSGPGYTTLELARCVGPEGRVIAVDRSDRFLDQLQALCRRHDIANVQTVLADAENVDLPDAAIDAAYARWLLCWVPDASLVIERVARLVKPGGSIILQEYFDWAAMKLMPASAPFRTAVDACMRSWPLANATIDIAEQFPQLAARHGLILEHFEPVTRVGGVGSLEWRWIMGFLRSYLPGLVDKGLLTAAQLAAFESDYQARTAEGTSRVFAPILADTVLRRPH